jgi:hypothetical protein
MYYATFVDKLVDRDYENEGCKGESRCVMAENISIGASTMDELLKQLSDMYGYDNSYWWKGEGSYISFNRMEDGDSNVLDVAACKALWAIGLPVYLCDYTFNIEWRETRNITDEEFKEACKAIGAVCE